MAWIEYLLAVGCVAAFFVGRGTANAGAYQRGYEDGRDDMRRDLSALAPVACADCPAGPGLANIHADMLTNDRSTVMSDRAEENRT